MLLYFVDWDNKQVVSAEYKETEKMYLAENKEDARRKGLLLRLGKEDGFISPRDAIVAAKRKIEVEEAYLKERSRKMKERKEILAQLMKKEK
jgi:hypothetical protein